MQIGGGLVRRQLSGAPLAARTIIGSTADADMLPVPRIADPTRCPDDAVSLSPIEMSFDHAFSLQATRTPPQRLATWTSVPKSTSTYGVRGEFQNTARGVMIATSIGRSITGKGGDRITVDDLHDLEQVESDAQRDGAISYFRTALATRLDNKKTGAMVVVMQIVLPRPARPSASGVRRSISR